MSSILNHSSRRQFLKGAGLASAATALTARTSIAKTDSSAALGQPQRAKNLIFLVADGMCNGTLALAHHWNVKNRDEKLNWMQLYGRDGLSRAFMETRSASSPVTDSAAAASAWGSGQRVYNGTINFSTEGKQLTPIYTYARAAGKATGLVTTCTTTHATPAGFVANVKSRGDEKAIAKQYLERDVDVILGGGVGQYKYAESEKDGVVQPAGNLFPDFEAKGYTIARNRSDLKRAKGSKKLLGLFSRGHIPYAIDRKNDDALSEVPSLPEMFEAALAALSGAKDGFVLQVEGGRVDHAGHANDAATILHEQLEFDDCIPIALEFVENNPDTLLIVTTDHGTGGCQLDGKGKAYAESDPALDAINSISQSFEWLEARFRKIGKFDAQVFEDAIGIKPTQQQAERIDQALNDPEMKYLSSFMTGVFEAQLWQKTAVGFTSNNHTSECVELLAFGPGSEAISHFIENRELFGYVTDALGLTIGSEQ
ncbi:MAG: alkaline phosphatase [Lentimonas sp.]